MPWYIDFMRHVIEFSTAAREELVDITERVRGVVAAHGTDKVLCALFAQGATAAVMIQENWDPNIRTDVLNCLRTLVPRGAWLHDEEDGNGDAHIKAGIVGPSEVIPIEGGRLMLGTWQNIFFCEFDGPRAARRVVVTLL
jgi:secondary thiamine-phosphate synthase enzyme